MDNLTTKEVVNHLMEKLNCKQKLICTFMGITPTTLSLNIAKPLAEIKDTKTGRRLYDLLYVVAALSTDESLTPEVLVRTLTSPHYEMSDGTVMDVIAGLHSELSRELLVDIAEKALSDFRRKYEKVPRSDKILQRVRSVYSDQHA
jgi:hypothetical protein